VPIYEYVCSACRHRIDILHGIYEEGPAFCPSCGANGTMRKAFVAPAVHFKGTGWAKRDRASGARTKAAAAESGGATSAASESGGDKSDRSESADKSDRSEVADKSDRSESADKSDRSESADKAPKRESTSAASSSDGND
jgi:putative FmdB family regulatory protein